MASETRTVPDIFSLENIGKPIKFGLWKRDDNGEIIDNSLGEYCGTLEAFHVDKNGLLFKLHGLDFVIALWAHYYIDAKRSND